MTIRPMLNLANVNYCVTVIQVTASHKAVSRIFFGGCHVELERRRRRMVGSGEGVSPSPDNFCIFYFKMVSFYACLHGFLFGIFFTVPSYATKHVIHVNCSKSAEIVLHCIDD